MRRESSDERRPERWRVAARRPPPDQNRRHHDDDGRATRPQRAGAATRSRGRLAAVAGDGRERAPRRPAVAARVRLKVPPARASRGTLNGRLKAAGERFSSSLSRRLAVRSTGSPMLRRRRSGIRPGANAAIPPARADRLRRSSPALALFPLRLFLGVTFVYAGIQKLTDPGFLHPGAPTYIGTQLHGFAAGTPGGFLLRDLRDPPPRAGRCRGRDHRDPDRPAGHRRAVHQDRGRRRDGPQPRPLPHRELAHHALLPRPRPRLLLRLAAVRADRRERPAGARQRRQWHPSAAMARRTRLRTGGGWNERSPPPRPAASCWSSSPGWRSAIAGISALAQGDLFGAASADRRLQGSGTGGSLKSGTGASGGSAASGSGAGRRVRLAPRGAVKLGPGKSSSQGTGCHLQRPHRRLARHPDPRVRRQPQGLQRRLHPCRLHGRLRRRRHRLPLPRRRVQTPKPVK